MPNYEESEDADYQPETKKESMERRKTAQQERQNRLDNRAKAFEKVKTNLKKVTKYDGILTCMVLDNNVPGIYLRIDGSSYTDINGKSESVGRLVWSHERTSLTEKIVVTHLCENENCYNPWHLCAESEKKRNIRTGCKGYCKLPSSPDLLIVCEHYPRCLNITELVEHSEDEELEEGSTEIDVEKYQTIDPSKIDPTPKKKSKIWKITKDTR